MQRFFNWVLAIGALVGLVYGIGWIVPRVDAAKAHSKFEARPDDVYKVVADVTTWPQWHPDVDSVHPHSTNRDHLTWDVTLKDGRTYELALKAADEGVVWSGNYSIDGTAVTLSFVFGHLGSGSRLYLTRTTDTNDPWRRARLFLWPWNESGPATVIDGLADYLGESARAEE